MQNVYYLGARSFLTETGIEEKNKLAGNKILNNSIHFRYNFNELLYTSIHLKKMNISKPQYGNFQTFKIFLKPLYFFFLSQQNKSKHETNKNTIIQKKSLAIELIQCCQIGRIQSFWDVFREVML